MEWNVCVYDKNKITEISIETFSIIQALLSAGFLLQV